MVTPCTGRLCRYFHWTLPFETLLGIQMMTRAYFQLFAMHKKKKEEKDDQDSWEILIERSMHPYQVLFSQMDHIWGRGELLIWPVNMNSDLVLCIWEWRWWGPDMFFVFVELWIWILIRFYAPEGFIQLEMARHRHGDRTLLSEASVATVPSRLYCYHPKSAKTYTLFRHISTLGPSWLNTCTQVLFPSGLYCYHPKSAKTYTLFRHISAHGFKTCDSMHASPVQALLLSSRKCKNKNTWSQTGTGYSKRVHYTLFNAHQLYIFHGNTLLWSRSTSDTLQTHMTKWKVHTMHIQIPGARVDFCDVILNVQKQHSPL